MKKIFLIFLLSLFFLNSYSKDFNYKNYNEFRYDFMNINFDFASKYKLNLEKDDYICLSILNIVICSCFIVTYNTNTFKLGNKHLMFLGADLILNCTVIIGSYE